MKLYKALKEKKTLISEITKLKRQINEKNSYIEGSLNAEKFNVNLLYIDLKEKIIELTILKHAITLANAPIQLKIFELSERKALVSFWNEVSVIEGSKAADYSDQIKTYKVQIDEQKRNEIIKELQKSVDELQEFIDVFNYNTEI